MSAESFTSALQPRTSNEIFTGNVMYENFIDVKEEYNSSEIVGEESKSVANRSCVNVASQTCLDLTLSEPLSSFWRVISGSKKIFICEKCNIDWPSLEAVVLHFRMHMRNKDGQDLLFQNFIIYYLTQAPDRCDICDLSFSCINEHKLHFELFHSYNYCCGKRMGIRWARLKHFKRFHPEKLVKCAVCTQVFVRNFDLLRHYRKKVGETSHAWYMKNFKSLTFMNTSLPDEFKKSTLKIPNDSSTVYAVHQNFVLVEQESNCPEIVELPISDSNATCMNVDARDKNHLDVSNSEQQSRSAIGSNNQKMVYTCSTCNMNCKNREVLVSHLKLHIEQSTSLKEPKKPKMVHACSKCNIKYKKQKDLVSHYKLHIKHKDVNGLKFHDYGFYLSTQEPQRCNICDMNFSGKKDQKIHFKHVHFNNTLFGGKCKASTPDTSNKSSAINTMHRSLIHINQESNSTEFGDESKSDSNPSGMNDGALDKCDFGVSSSEQLYGSLIGPKKRKMVDSCSQCNIKSRRS